MGLERISALMQGTHDNYQTDTFKHLIGAVAQAGATGAVCQRLAESHRRPHPRDELS